MKYIIYEMVTPEHLQRTVYKDYYHKTVYRNVLEEIDINGVESRHDSMELAMDEIKKHALKLQGLSLTVMPVINVNYEGIIS